MIKTNLNNIVKAVLNLSEQTDRQGVVRSYTLEQFADGLCYWVRNREEYLTKNLSNIQSDLRAEVTAREEGAPHYDASKIPTFIERISWTREQLEDVQKLRKPIDELYKDACGKDYVPRAAKAKGGAAITDAAIAEALGEALAA
tara:strand:+ start:132 stop:563 length:432 start_codon:yes stop_codon:yes gene_type:complete